MGDRAENTGISRRAKLKAVTSALSMLSRANGSVSTGSTANGRQSRYRSDA